MKLIELLARELKEWPSNADWCVAIGDGEKFLASFGIGAHPKPDSLDTLNHTWTILQSAPPIRWACRQIPLSDEPCDRLTAIINREHWENATDQPFDPIPGSTTISTLETMLAEWRDLTARAQAAQAEADALFEHAGQCHGEIVVRLAELGWGAPRVVAVASEPANDGWVEWAGGVCPVDLGTRIDTKYRDGDEMFNGEAGQFGTKTSEMFWLNECHKNDIVAYRLTPSAQQ